MKKLLLALIFASAANIYSQVDVSAKMGVSLFAAPSFKDYINVYYAAFDDKMNSFSTSVQFSGEAAFTVNPNFQIGIEYAHQIFSYSTFSGKAGLYEISFYHMKPSLLAYYVIPGNGFKFKLGGGAGYRYAVFDEKSLVQRDYSASGFGLVLKAQGVTLLSGNLYANISADARMDFTGDITGDKADLAGADREPVNLHLYSIGLSLGVSYFF